MESLDAAITRTRAHLLSLRNAAGHWEGELSSSALSTATAIVALHTVDPDRHAAAITAGVSWLVQHQNADGGWGDTTISQSNLSTTLLVWSALHRLAAEETATTCRRAEEWIRARTGSLEPEDLMRAVVARYGKDKTFSVPILMLCAIGGTLGDNPWRRVLPLPFELAALPRAWFGAIGLPVVSYALPALIAIGHARFHHAPPAAWNPLRWLRAALWSPISPMLRTLQPASGGYLEATPLTSFVTMALAAAGEKHHPCVAPAVDFLLRSMRPDGSWPIDTNLATWGTTLAVKALGEIETATAEWLLDQQYREVHPFTGAAPGGWAWTDLPGGVPDADDSPGVLIALDKIQSRRVPHAPTRDPVPAAAAGVTWLLDLQNRDGGMPTFCRGWGTLPFDRSTPELTAHALLAWHLWHADLDPALRVRIRAATDHALTYLRHTRRANGSWIPLWFGNEHAHNEENPVYGTAQVTAFLSLQSDLAAAAAELIQSGTIYLIRTQKSDGSWGGDAGAPASIEETAVATHALALQADPHARTAARRGADWLIQATREGTEFPASPIGLYFARLWYHEKLYPIVFTLQALRAVRALD
jgi:squalene-hopene/tetraprenyl-beta-curcumene cyclase